MKKRPKSKYAQKNKKKNTGKFYIAAIMLFLVFVMSIQMVRLYQKNKEYVVKEQALSSELEGLQEEQKELQNQEEYSKTSDYVEDVARSKGGMAYDDEVIFREE